MIVPLFRSLSELSQSYEDVFVIYRKLEQLVLKWTCNKQMWIKETMIFLKVLTERNCRKTENKLKTQSVVLLPLIPSKIIYTRCISPISSKRTLRSSCSDLVHAQWDPQTGNQRSPPGLQVAWSGQTRPDATFRLVKKKMSDYGQSKNDRLLLVNKRLERFACAFMSLLSCLSDVTQTKTERLVIHKWKHATKCKCMKIEIT